MHCFRTRDTLFGAFAYHVHKGNHLLSPPLHTMNCVGVFIRLDYQILNRPI